jgi:hypothetical protein
VTVISPPPSSLIVDGGDLPFAAGFAVRRLDMLTITFHDRRK